jgi:hypothetical protein
MGAVWQQQMTHLVGHYMAQQLRRMHAKVGAVSPDAVVEDPHVYPARLICAGRNTEHVRIAALRADRLRDDANRETA